MSTQPKHKHAFKDNIQHAMPKLHSNCEGGYAVDDDSLSQSNYEAQDDIIQMQLNSRKLANGKLMDMSEACTTLKDNQDDDLLCWFEEDDVDDNGAGTCVCEFESQQDCKTWFHGQDHMKHVVEDMGMLLFGGDKCSCTAEPNGDGDYECHFGLLSEMPKVRQNPGDSCDGSIELAGKKPVQCEEKKCKPEFDVCQTLQFGDHNCGYSCFQGAEEHYCDRNCHCHKELSEEEVQQDKKLSDDTCEEGHVCDDMISCTKLDYGDYGCGYTCKDVKNTVYFCGQDCECEVE